MTPPAYPSIDVVNDEVKAITDTTLAERDTVNTRASFILGSGSIIIASATGVLGAVPTITKAYRGFVHWALAVDIALYVMVVLFAGLAYAENNFRSVNVFHLPDYLPLQEYETRRRLLATRLANELINRDTIARKTRSTVIALAALIAEVVLLAVTLIVVAAG